MGSIGSIMDPVLDGIQNFLNSFFYGFSSSVDLGSNAVGSEGDY
ncbi:hypothetical protein [Rhodococcus gannanensis]|jgi:hypothetical protein|uniref:Uncharacterized protein n=1 Tax=Rhodococcus gannanensis TaxID=1960308 RepID=A0ABW4P5X0_9NOCA